MLSMLSRQREPGIIVQTRQQKGSGYVIAGEESFPSALFDLDIHKGISEMTISTYRKLPNQKHVQ